MLGRKVLKFGTTLELRESEYTVLLPPSDRFEQGNRLMPRLGYRWQSNVNVSRNVQVQ